MTSSSSASPSDRIVVVACGAIARHVDDVAQRRRWDFIVRPLPPLLHNHPQDIAAAVEAEVLAAGDAHVIVAYADCGTYGALDAVIDRHGLGRLRGEHCYDVFAGAEAIAAMLADEPGTYFLTDYLVKSFHRSVVVELGLDTRPELAEDYFRHYTRVVWLAQTPTGELRVAAQAAADIMGLALEERVVGDVGLEAQLEVLLRGRMHC